MSESNHEYRVRPKLVRGWTLPTNQPRILLAQLRTDLDLGGFDDHRIRTRPSDDYRRRLFSVLELSLQTETHFVVFPECTWPLAWACDVRDWIQEHGRECAAYVIPFEHASLAEYDTVMRDMGVQDAVCVAELRDVIEHAGGVPEDSIFVNALVICIRLRGGRVCAIPQRKLRPAKLEGLQHTGRWRFVGATETRLLKGQSASKEPVLLATMICFDAIAHDQRFSMEPIEVVLRARPTYLFIPECNPEPLHSEYSKFGVRLTGSAQVPPVVAFCNVARGSVPPLNDAAFGFSRVIGELGIVAPEQLGTVVCEGVLVDDSVRSLADIRQSPRVLSDRSLRSLYIRAEQTALLIEPPPVGEHPSKKPTYGSFNTTAEVFHYLGHEHGWERFLTVEKNAKPTHAQAIPDGHLVRWQLLGIETVRERLLGLLDKTDALVWLTGDGGGGKSALAARVLKDTAAAQRVIWIDLGQIQHHSQALLEELLLRLGQPNALTLPFENQLSVARQKAGEASTTIVLDSFDRWREDGLGLPEWVRTLIGWNRRVLITTRDVSADEPAVISVPRLLSEDAKALIRTVAGDDHIPESYVEALAAATENLPLGCVWAGELYRASKTHALQVAGKLGGAALVSLFHACVDGLNATDRDVLGVICTLPAPISESDIAGVLQISEVAAHAAGRLLVDRSLAMYLTDPVTGVETLHFRHPFVRQFWRKAHEQDPYGDRIVVWAEHVLKKHGGHRNWRGLPELDIRWKNIGFVLRKIARTATGVERERFLSLWLMADTFLWSSKRWRERMEFGELALQFSRELNDRRSEGCALYESLAQPKWHLDPEGGEVENLINDAIRIFREIDDQVELARAVWYRSRMLRSRGEAADSLITAQEALAIAIGIHESAPARQEDAKNCVALAHHGIANALVDLGRGDEALESYETARQLFEEIGDPEMLAVIQRRIGIVHLQASRFGAAAKALKASVEAFRSLRIQLEEAESVTFHARAIAALGEIDEALAEHEYADAVLRPLGSKVRNRELDATRDYIGAISPKRA